MEKTESQQKYHAIPEHLTRSERLLFLDLTEGAMSLEEIQNGSQYSKAGITRALNSLMRRGMVKLE